MKVFYSSVQSFLHDTEVDGCMVAIERYKEREREREREESREGKQASENREREVQLIEQVIN